MVPRYAAYEGVEATGIRVPLHLPLRAEQPEQQADAAGKADDAEMDQQSERAEAGAGAAGSSGQPAAGASSGGEQEAGASGAAAPTGLRRHADLWQCQQGGVQRVFVDHPLFTSSGGCCHSMCPPVLPDTAHGFLPLRSLQRRGTHAPPMRAAAGC